MDGSDEPSAADWQLKYYGGVYYILASMRVVRFHGWPNENKYFESSMANPT